MDIPGLVQTSLNLGILRLTEEEATATFSIRSSIESEKQELGDRLRHCVEFLGGTYEEKGSYPGWEYRHESELAEYLCVCIQENVRPESRESWPSMQVWSAACSAVKWKVWTASPSDPESVLDIHTPKERLQAFPPQNGSMNL